MSVNLGHNSFAMSASNKIKGYNSAQNNSTTSQVNEAAVAYETSVSRFSYYLGGQTINKGKPIEGTQDFIELIRKGISRKSLDHLMETTGITAPEMSAILHTSDRTLRRYTPSKLLNPEQSERVFELARLYSRGEEVFGNLDGFKNWINSTVIALGNKKPKEFLDTSIGIDMLMEELGRIEHGIFA
jgi:putative toxin-antitoxin system antitoxin component (TIGR02293 family)